MKKFMNKKTGEVAEFVVHKRIEDSEDGNQVYAPFDFNPEEWEDYEEPKEYYFINACGEIETTDREPDDELAKQMHPIGNYFETEEETEKAAEKLKAFKRLKDKGFRFTLTPGVGSLDITPGKFQIEINADMPAKWFCCDDVQEDLDTCFGGEE